MRETIVTPKSAATAYVSAFFVGEERPVARLGMVIDLTFDDKDNPEFDIAIGNYGGGIGSLLSVLVSIICVHHCRCAVHMTKAWRVGGLMKHLAVVWRMA